MAPFSGGPTRLHHQSMCLVVCRFNCSTSPSNGATNITAKAPILTPRSEERQVECPIVWQPNPNVDAPASPSVQRMITAKPLGNGRRTLMTIHYHF
jgi:hypothetical protein